MLWYLSLLSSSIFRNVIIRIYVKHSSFLLNTPSRINHMSSRQGLQQLDVDPIQCCSHYESLSSIVKIKVLLMRSAFQSRSTWSLMCWCHVKDINCVLTKCFQYWTIGKIYGIIFFAEIITRKWCLCKYLEQGGR